MMICWDEKMFHSLYAMQTEHGWITYSREFAQRFENPQTDSLDWVMRRLDILPALEDPIAIVGCGFGFLVELLIDKGHQAFGIDCSPYIHAHKGTESREDVKIFDAMVGRDQLGMHAAMVIDEDAASSHSDAELPAFFAGLETISSRVIHLVSPLIDRPGDSAINWKPIEEWQRMAPTHLWIPLGI